MTFLNGVYNSQPSKPEDFEEALKSLESGFVAIAGNQVRFVNPSVRDFLKEHLSDGDFLRLLPTLCVRAEWAQNLWNHLKHTLQTDPDKLKALAQAFFNFATKLGQIPNFKKVKLEQYNYWYSELDDLSIADRGSLLLDLFEHSDDRGFLDAAISVLKRLRDECRVKGVEFGWEGESCYEVFATFAASCTN